MRRATIALLVLAVGCSSGGNATPADCPNQPGSVTFPRTASALRVDVADDDASREQGLMGVTHLPSDKGMAFVWTSPTDATFWMKDTLIPLSIAFVDQDHRVITLDEMTPCTGDPCPTYGATGLYATAIEANTGWFAEHGIVVGDLVSIMPPTCL
jgi:uncharacterized membrane protein (UPF0127 family)